MSLFNNVPAPPLIPSSANLDDNTTRRFITKETEAIKITDGQAFFENGFLRNLNEPVDDKDVATKNYVDTFSGGGGVPAGVDTNIQINDGAGNFTASPNLIFDTGITTVTGDILIDGAFPITLSGGILGDLSEPVNPQDAATKNYVDTMTSKLTEVNIDVGFFVGHMLTPVEVYNTIVNLEISGILAP